MLLLLELGIVEGSEGLPLDRVERFAATDDRVAVHLRPHTRRVPRIHVGAVLVHQGEALYLDVAERQLLLFFVNAGGLLHVVGRLVIFASLNEVIGVSIVMLMHVLRCRVGVGVLDLWRDAVLVDVLLVSQVRFILVVKLVSDHLVRSGLGGTLRGLG